jgi:predicted nucleic acid-binding protein
MTNGRLVVDASILAKAYLRDETFNDVARAILTDYALGTLELFAPQFLLYEIPSAIQGAVRRRRLDAAEAKQAITHFFALSIPTVGDSETMESMITAAYATGERLGCRLYDALYLIVADGLRAPFVTADRKLFNTISERWRNVVWIEEYARQNPEPSHEG